MLAHLSRWCFRLVSFNEMLLYRFKHQRLVVLQRQYIIPRLRGSALLLLLASHRINRDNRVGLQRNRVQ